MNVLFLSLGRYWSINESEGYTDILREFIRHGHYVYIVSPIEKRQEGKNQIIEEEHSIILKVRTGNIQKTNIIEKGISTVLIEAQFRKAIKTYLSGIKFDLVLYPTPPITLVKVVEYVKNRDKAMTYLLLKDIFPQNALDIGIMKKTGIWRLVYYYFRRKEKRLYSVSDRIGCMSPANVKYVREHNPEVNPGKIEICPNVIEVSDKSIDQNTRTSIRNKYGIPLNKRVFVYGGNLGRPQGIDFLIDCLDARRNDDSAFFLVIGDGTEYYKLCEYNSKQRNKNFKLMRRLPKEDYDLLVASSDIGLIFLDHRFTIPNFPSRLLGYMQAKIPVIACTDINTDIGSIIQEGKFGWWCESNNVQYFCDIIDKLKDRDIVESGINGYDYLVNNYSAIIAYETIEGLTNNAHYTD